VRAAAAYGELVVAGVQEPFDRFGTEDVGEAFGQADGGGTQRELLVDGQIAARLSFRGDVGHVLLRGVLAGGVRAGVSRLMRSAISV
jgi:hypothetical protein